MRFLARTSALVAVALLLTVSTAIAADEPGNRSNAQQCQKGGWQHLFTSTGERFMNEGSCSSYAAQGGRLYTAVADVSLSWRPIEPQPPFGNPGVEVFVTNDGPSSVTVQTQVVFNLGEVDNQLLLAPGETRLAAGGTAAAIAVTGYAQVTSATAYDPDSTPNNYIAGAIGPTLEDDEVIFTGPTPP